MKIGQIYTFDYQSKNVSNRKYTEAVRVKLTEPKLQEVIANIIAYSDKAEKDFASLTYLLTEQKFFDCLKALAQLDAERKGRGARARKNDEQKNLEVIVEGQYEAFIKKFANEDAPTKEKNIIDLFIRQYSLEGIALKEDGAHKAILISKSFNKDGGIKYKFISLSPVIVEKAQLYQLKDFEYA